ncbi:hypothetical protein SNEBB_007527 [Seison nebaliae]|nr:hypothetical protein SNEBB_007527 [Seison nebaliae]
MMKTNILVFFLLSNEVYLSLIIYSYNGPHFDVDFVGGEYIVSPLAARREECFNSGNLFYTFINRAQLSHFLKVLFNSMVFNLEYNSTTTTYQFMDSTFLHLKTNCELWEFNQASDRMVGVNQAGKLVSMNQASRARTLCAKNLVIKKSVNINLVTEQRRITTIPKLTSIMNDEIRLINFMGPVQCFRQFPGGLNLNNYQIDLI